MLKLLFVLTFLVNLNIAFSQPGVVKTATVKGTATVILGVSLSQMGSNSLNFGEKLLSTSSQSYSISPVNGQRFIATGQVGKSVILSYNSSVVLNNTAWAIQHGGTSGTLTFTTGGNNIVQTENRVTYNTPINLVNGGSVVLKSLNNVGTLYIWVGGSITIPANHPNGAYTGSFNISIAY